MSQAKKWGKASLRIHSTVMDVKSITNVLQTEPTQAAKKGSLMSPRNPKSAVFEANMWVLDSRLESDHSIEDHINNLLEFIERKLPYIKELMENCQFDLFCGYSSDSGQGRICLEAEMVKRLTVIPVDLIFDIYTSSQ